MNLHKKADAERSLTNARATVRTMRAKGVRAWSTLAQFLMADAQLRFLDGNSWRALLTLRAAKKCARNAKSPTLLARV
ncbi:MAG: hypothetical protein P1V36_16855, partial [Planctomycetota bacterium]|nr:hypothetical protein [Planctomycetota bacterium]